MTLDLAIYDIETCEPITDTWVEIWCKYLPLRHEGAFAP